MDTFHNKLPRNVTIPKDLKDIQHVFNRIFSGEPNRLDGRSWFVNSIGFIKHQGGLDIQGKDISYGWGH
jgi:hypothetical protein